MQHPPIAARRDVGMAPRLKGLRLPVDDAGVRDQFGDLASGDDRLVRGAEAQGNVRDLPRRHLVATRSSQLLHRLHFCTADIAASFTQFGGQFFQLLLRLLTLGDRAKVIGEACEIPRRRRHSPGRAG